MDSKEVLKEYMKAFSENLRELRKEKYKTTNALANNSSFDPSNYSKYENGKGNPTLETVLKMSSAFGIPPNELLNFEFDMEKYKIDQ